MDNFRGAGAAIDSQNEYCHALIQHESIHHGQWSRYPALAGFSAPKLWREVWHL
ncbi:MAG: hypothetical protein HY921_07115 [Elusimicrobia bacterium]|nr:hypothetical protein [Elusimicrobiota bacterium]